MARSQPASSPANCSSRSVCPDIAETTTTTSSPDVLANVFWSAVHGLVSLHVAGKLVHGPGIEQLIEPVLLTLFAGNQSLAPTSAIAAGEES